MMVEGGGGDYKLASRLPLTRPRIDSATMELVPF